MTRLSVDFGTSNTVAVLGLPDGRVRALLFDGSPTMPSAVYLEPSGNLLVGRDAVHTARTSPDRFEPNPKRRIDEHAVLLGGADVPVVDLITAVLARVAGEARRVAGGPIGAVTLTHPAAWAHTRRQVLVEAAGRAGIPPTTLVAEPVAAADTFLAVSGDTVPVGACVVVYDLGAGTFDASVVRRTVNGFDVVAAEGLNQAGGLDIDAAIVAYLGAANAGRDGGAFVRLLNPTTTEERRANRLLWEDVRNAKELLSRATSTQVHVPLVGVDVPLGRDQFELLARPILDATVNATRAALNTAQVRPGDLAGIFLVGGGSRIPLVSALLAQSLGRAPTATEQPELVVAEGGLRSVGGMVGAPLQTMIQPAQPVSAQPVSGHPAQPISAHPAAPVSPYQPPTQTSAYQPPTQTGAYHPPIPAQPTGAHQPQPFTGPIQPPGPPNQPNQQARRNRTILLAAGAALVVLVMLGAAGLWLILRDGDSVDVGREFYSDGGRTITLTSMEYRSDNEFRINFRYVNGGKAPWALTCPAATADLRSSYLIINRSTVFPTETRCSSDQPRGNSFNVAVGDTLVSYAVFPTAPAEGTTFALQWYTFPRVTGLKR